MQLFHKHLLINAETENLKGYLEPDKIKEHLREIAETINSIIIIEPQVEYSNADGNTGYTGICGVTTSHISCHHWDNLNPNRLQIDVYSCTNYDYIRVIEKVKKFWNIKKGNYILLDRNPRYRFKMSKQGKL